MPQSYIRRLGEIYAPPPYLLGNPMISHTFALNADQTQLQSLLDEKLNAAIPSGKNYVYNAVTDKVLLTFARYEKAESASVPDTGFLSYTEAMLGFLVRRTDPNLGGTLEGELLTYLAAVWIDDRDFTGPIEDPYSMPILRGREWYGMPKYGGPIEYDPLSVNAPKAPKVDIWDLEDGTERLVLAPGIRVYADGSLPSGVSAPGGGAPVSPGGGPPEGPGPPGPPEFRTVAHRLNQRLERETSQGHRLRARLLQSVAPKIEPPRDQPPDPEFHFLAQHFGVSHDDLNPRIPPQHPSGPVHHESARQITIEGVGEVLAHNDLKYRSRLVGLKEFPDPKKPGDACYQAIVESPLVEKSMSPNQPLYEDQWVEFPPLKRPDMDLIAQLGLQGFVDRRVLVPRSVMFGVTGTLLFADPERVEVRELYP